MLTRRHGSAGVSRIAANCSASSRRSARLLGDLLHSQTVRPVRAPAGLLEDFVGLAGRGLAGGGQAVTTEGPEGKTTPARRQATPGRDQPPTPKTRLGSSCGLHPAVMWEVHSKLRCLQALITARGGSAPFRSALRPNRHTDSVTG